MKTFEIELKRVSYVTLYIEAENEDQAEQLAWDEIQAGESYGISDDADWSLSYVTESKINGN